MKNNSFRFNKILSLSTTFSLLVSGAAVAEETLFVAGYGGSNEAVIRERILKPFAEANKVNIEYVAGTSTSNLARLLAQKNNPEIDFAILDDGPMEQAVSLGMCATIQPFPALSDLYPIATASGQGKSVGIGIVATGLAYNTQLFAKNGWPAPTSWADLADKRYKGQLLVPSLTNSYGLHTLLALAKTENEQSKSLDKTFKYIIDNITPNVFSFESASGKISELYQNGDISMGVWGSGRTFALAKSGFPIKFVTPKEGAVALQTAVCPVVGSNVPELQQKLVQEFLKPEIQKILAENVGWGPTNTKAVLSPAEAEGVVYGQDAVSKLIPVDWASVNSERSEWTRRWSRQVER